ncbi:MAG: hypothetical protein HQL57_01860 [Magnetococcales bacterium]|nr:hypothetical protein [Magnetococcales bacterium]MBF0155915.1 hypothetical protein [Magnetococcales bacterium]
MSSNDAAHHKLFSHPPMVADLPRHFVDPKVVERLDLDRMERVNAKFHAEGDERRNWRTVHRYRPCFSAWSIAVIPRPCPVCWTN